MLMTAGALLGLSLVLNFALHSAGMRKLARWAPLIVLAVYAIGRSQSGHPLW